MAIELNDPAVAGALSAVAGGGITGVFVRWRLGRGDILLRFIAQQQEEMNNLRRRVDELEGELRAALERERRALASAASGHSAMVVNVSPTSSEGESK